MDTTDTINAINNTNEIVGGNFIQQEDGNYLNNIFGIRFYYSNEIQRFIVYIIGSIEGTIFTTVNDFINAYNMGQFG